MEQSAFAAELARDGFSAPVLRDVRHAFGNGPHRHPWRGRFLVLSGWFEVTCHGRTERFGPGDWCSIPAHTLHSEAAGSDGVSYLSSRRD